MWWKVTIKKNTTITPTTTIQEVEGWKQANQIQNRRYTTIKKWNTPTLRKAHLINDKQTRFSALASFVHFFTCFHSFAPFACWHNSPIRYARSYFYNIVNMISSTFPRLSFVYTFCSQCWMFQSATFVFPWLSNLLRVFILCVWNFCSLFFPQYLYFLAIFFFFWGGGASCDVTHRVVIFVPHS